MSINLARKWRSKQFDELVGQSLAVRLIKNSLYRNLLFPVYLLSGMRGTGKTSTARIFAAALNCTRLKAFQDNPREATIPCLACPSCKAMQQMNHPDFMEIDAASNTGVDNVRQIIDSASFIPVLGAKKIYLIDEAHMLSKAAFNAFLKVLEEPPANVVFMLATTDSHKILPTVVSRCFQLFFDPIKPSVVAEYLTHVCKEEGLPADPDALLLIAHETEGSLRDALNLLERLRGLPDLTSVDMKSSRITSEAVRNVLGSIDDERIGELLCAVISEDIPQVLTTCSQLELSRYNPTMVWKKLVETLGRSLWLKQNTAPDEIPVAQSLKRFVEAASYKHLVSLLEICYSYELTFAKTTAPATLLEVILLKMVSIETDSSRPAKPLIAQKREEKKEPIAVRSHPEVAPQLQKEVLSEKSESKTDSAVVDSKSVDEGAVSSTWTTCVTALEGVSDPLVLSIFKQCSSHVFEESKRTLELTFSQDLIFFKDWLGKTEKIWRPTLEKFYGAGIMLVSKFDGVSVKERPVVMTPVKPIGVSMPAEPISQAPVKKSSAPFVPAMKPAVKAAAQTVKAVSAQAVEKMTNASMLMELFPGRIVEYDLIAEGSHES